MRAGRAAGVDLSQHRAYRLDPDELRQDDLVLVMERGQLYELLSWGRPDRTRIHLLGSFATGGPEEIEDPFDGPEEAFRTCVEHVGASVAGLVVWLERQASCT